MRVHAFPQFAPKPHVCSLATIVVCLALWPQCASAQYVSTNIVSNAPGALQQDPNLVNGWGLASFRPVRCG